MLKKMFKFVALVMLMLAVTYWLLPPTELNPAAKNIIDMHVHVGCVGLGESGCFVSKELSESYKFPFYLRAFGTTLDELEQHGDGIVLQKISAHIFASQHVSKAVILAMDGVVDRTSGEMLRDKTQVFVPNSYLMRELPKYDNLLFGASVNPYRKDWEERLEKAKANGAVLIKWIPAIMDIEPNDPAIEAYYRKLVALDLPLLSHAGQERSFAHANDSLGDPLRLEFPLSLGVTVIAAHIATTGETDGEDNFERILPLFERYPNLYAEISSLTQINKLGFLARALERPDIVARLMYGTDYPLQFFPLVSPWYQIRHVSPGTLKAVQQIDNQWDRDVALKRAMGVPESVFARSAEVLVR